MARLDQVVLAAVLVLVLYSSLADAKTNVDAASVKPKSRRDLLLAVAPHGFGGPPSSEAGVTLAQQGGSLTKGTTDWVMACSPGSFITGIAISGNDALLSNPKNPSGPPAPQPVLEALGPITCSKGPAPITTCNPRPSGANPNRKTWSPKSPIGYKRINIQAGELLDGIQLVQSDGGLQPGLGALQFFGGSGGTKQFVACPMPSQVITGLYGRATPTNGITVGLDCKKVA